MRNRNRPVRGGWSIKTLPPSVANEQLIWAWETRAKRNPSTPDNAVHEMKSFLRVNGIVVTTALIREIGEIADAQYCATEPNRCPRMRRVSQPASRSLTATKTAVGQPVMSWAARFWATINVLIASDYQRPCEVAQRAALMALDLVSGNDGCPHCVEHWNSLLAAAPPMDVIADNNDMRVWFWRAHNISREGREPVPFNKIAREWKWPQLADEVVRDTVARMGMTDLV